MDRLCWLPKLCVWVLSVFLVGSQMLLADSADSVMDPSRFEIVSLVSGLKQPMELAIAPDGTIFFIELEGLLKTIHPQTHEVRVIGQLVVTTVQENGLIGLALDPKFADNSWIYLQYSPPDYPGQHVSRFTLVDGKLDLSTEKVLFKYEEQRRECCHHAGSLHFGPNGDLYIGTGDNTNPFDDSQGYAPIDERPDRFPWDAQRTSGNTNNYNGKILRIKPTDAGGYEIPEGNLFPADGSQGRPEIYVMGCRNPWRLNVDSKTGFLYWGDVGPDAGSDGPRGPRGHDEINQARRAGNFGWPYFVANNLAYFHVDFATGTIGAQFDSNGPVNNSPNNTGIKQLPPAQPALIFYPGGKSPIFPELAQGGRTACAGPVYHAVTSSPSQRHFPTALDGALFIYEWSRSWIKIVYLDENSQVKRIEPFMPETAFSRPIDMEFGPHGELYLIEYGETWGINANARLVRIDYIRGNRAPIAIATAENNIGKDPLSVTFSSQGTYDKDVIDNLRYEWRVSRATDNKESKDLGGRDANTAAVSTAAVVPVVYEVASREPHPTITFNTPGVYNVELVVTDPHGATGSASMPVLVGNERPAIRFVAPQSGDFYSPEVPVRFELLVKDAEDGTNDDDEVDQQGLGRLIDGDAPRRVSLNVSFSQEPIPTGKTTSDPDQGPLGMRMMKRSDCFNCHAVDQKRVGPMLLEVAAKYRDKDGALEASVQRVLKGSMGAWGKIPMIPHAQHTADEVREMVGWVYSLQPTGLLRVFSGFAGEIPLTKEESSKPGHYKLEANYVDRGAGTVPPLSAATTIYLRPRHVEAESADDVHGPKVLSSNRSSSGKHLGAINHNHYVHFTSVNLDDVRRLTVQVASAGSGGTIEVRRDQLDGELLGTIPVENNGDWEKWYERSVELAPATGRHDLYLRFVNPTKTDGLMNIDTIDFQ